MNNGLKLFITSKNSSKRIFSEKYEETPSERNKPNLRKTAKTVAKIPSKVTYFFTKEGVEIVMVTNNNNNAVARRVKVGPITTKLKPKSSEIPVIFYS